jgi:hypothetical protein
VAFAGLDHFADLGVRADSALGDSTVEEFERLLAEGRQIVSETPGSAAGERTQLLRTLNEPTNRVRSELSLSQLYKDVEARKKLVEVRASKTFKDHWSQLLLSAEIPKEEAERGRLRERWASVSFALAGLLT